MSIAPVTRVSVALIAVSETLDFMSSEKDPVRLRMNSEEVSTFSSMTEVAPDVFSESEGFSAVGLSVLFIFLSPKQVFKRPDIMVRAFSEVL